MIEIWITKDKKRIAKFVMRDDKLKDVLEKLNSLCDPKNRISLRLIK